MLKRQTAVGERSLVIYVLEGDPRTNDDWSEVKRRTFGGDDGVEFIDAVQLEAMIAAAPNARHLGITCDEDSMELFIIEWS